MGNYKFDLDEEIYKILIKYVIIKIAKVSNRYEYLGNLSFLFFKCN